jgi:RNA polymerase sigma-70 factor (ECF subfamily)
LETLPDEELIARVRAGDKDLYEILVRRYNERLYRVARAIVRNSEEAADIVQETLVRAFAQLGQFSGAARFSTWLTKIAVYEALARLRQRARITDLEIATHSGSQSVVDALESLSPSPEEQTLRTQALEMLEAAVDALPPALRSVFMMREIEEMSTRETARVPRHHGGGRKDPVTSRPKTLAQGHTVTGRRRKQPSVPVSWCEV